MEKLSPLLINEAGQIARTGLRYLNEQQPQDAMTCFDSLISAMGSAWIFAHRGEAALQLNLYDQALRDFDIALLIQPAYPWAWAHKGLCLRRMYRFEEALTAFNHALALQPENDWTRLHRVNMLTANAQFEEALRELDRILINNPQAIPSVQGERGLLLNALGRYSETLQICQEALHQDPADMVALYSLAVARTMLHGISEEHAFLADLLITLRTRRETDPSPALYYRYLGVQALLGQGNEALQGLAALVQTDMEANEVRKHDPAWLAFREDPLFKAMTYQIPAEATRYTCQAP